MVAIVSGNSLGLERGSLAILGADASGSSNASSGQVGSASHGQSGERAYVDVSSGNLVLQDLDGLLVGAGADVAMLRTYNSQGLVNFTNNDGWSLQYKAIVALPGSNVLRRTDADGSSADYAWDAASHSYLSEQAVGGALERITVDADGSLVWHSGSNGSDGSDSATETYQGSGAGLIQSSSDASGNTLGYSYASNGLLLRVADASGETVLYNYNGRNLTGVSIALASGQILNEVAYSYDAQNRLSAVSINLDPDGTLPAGSGTLSTYTTRYSYDGNSDRITGIAQSDGTRQTFS